MTNQDKVPAALLVFSIGPVQDFIATARRTQDLWMGSYILAYLSAAAMRVLAGNDLNVILYPTLDQQPLVEKLWKGNDVNTRQLTLATLPNKFTAAVDSIEAGISWNGQKREIGW